jgi:hypothetical protein
MERGKKKLPYMMMMPVPKPIYSFSTRIINAPRSDGGSNLSSSHAMQLPLANDSCNHTTPYYPSSLFMETHTFFQSSIHYQDCILENSNFKEPLSY